ncbi:hypothetical protein WDW37_07595 [Bdellovibrionota bacterium FG-1]
MKKIILTVSACMVIGFAVALANASDDMNSPQTTQQTTQQTTKEAQSSMTQQPGTMAPETPLKTESTASTTSTDKWTHSKTCTDASGVTHHRGKKGFSQCIDEMKKSDAKEQMGGTAGSESTEPSKPSDTSSKPSDTSSGSTAPKEGQSG